LDEVGDIPSALQPKLLRVLQEQEFERLGSCRTHKVDVRLVAATNRDLEGMVAHHEFRSDLYYRLNVFPLSLPPLRERREDIPALVEHFVGIFSCRMRRPIHRVPPETLAAFSSYSWPGNIRELQNVIERAIILCEGETFSVDETWLQHESGRSAYTSAPLVKLVAREREVIESALADCNGRISGPFGAAARLGIPRQTLEYKLAKLGIDIYRFKTDRLAVACRSAYRRDRNQGPGYRRHSRACRGPCHGPVPAQRSSRFKGCD